MEAGDTLDFTYQVSSEATYDTLTVTIPDGALPAISGEQTRTTSYTASAPGDYTFSFSYKKDNSAHRGQDKGMVYNIVLTPAP